LQKKKSNGSAIMNDKQLLRRAWDALDTFKQAYPENWHGEDQQVLDDLIKADVAQPEPKPVAWYFAKTPFEWESVALDADLDDAQKANCVPLYTAPPKKEWVGLTDEDRWELVQKTPSFDEAVAAVEAKLKEKNT